MTAYRRATLAHGGARSVPNMSIRRHPTGTSHPSSFPTMSDHKRTLEGSYGETTIGIAHRCWDEHRGDRGFYSIGDTTRSTGRGHESARCRRWHHSWCCHRHRVDIRGSRPEYQRHRIKAGGTIEVVLPDAFTNPGVGAESVAVLQGWQASPRVVSFPPPVFL
jgi:hypothetical protein